MMLGGLLQLNDRPAEAMYEGRSAPTVGGLPDSPQRDASVAFGGGSSRRAYHPSGLAG